MVSRIGRVRYAFPSGANPFETVHIRAPASASGPLTRAHASTGSLPSLLGEEGADAPMVRTASALDLRNDPTARSSPSSWAVQALARRRTGLAPTDESRRSAEGRVEGADARPRPENPARPSRAERLACPPSDREGEAAAVVAQDAPSPEGELTSTILDAAMDSNFWWKVPKPIDPSVEPEDQAGTSLSFSGSSLDLAVTHLSPHGHASTTYTLSLLNSGLNAEVDLINGRREIDTSLYMSPGWLELDATGVLNLRPGQLWGNADGGSIGGVGTLAAWSDFVGGGAELDAALNETVSGHAALFLSASADRQVRYLGPYRGPDPALRGRHTIETEDTRGYWNSADAGLFAKLGFGLVWSWTRQATVRYTEHVSLEEAAARLKEERGALRRIVRNLCRSVGRPLDEAALPDRQDPLSRMTPGSELSFVAEGEHQVALFGGLALFKAGLSGAWASGFEFSVERRPGSEVALSVRPVRMSQSGAYLGSARYFGLDGTRTEVVAERTTYSLSADNSGDRAILNALITAETPLRDRRQGSRAARFDPKQIPGWANRTIRETSHERSRLMSWAGYFGTKVFFLLPGGQARYLGLSISPSRGRETLTRKIPGWVLTRTTHEAHLRTEKLVFGNLRASTFVSVLEAAPEGREHERGFAAAILRSEMSDSKVVKDGENRRFVRALNDAFGTQLRETQRPGRGQTRIVSVQRILSSVHLASLAKRTLEDVARVADRSGIGASVLSALVVAIRRAPRPEAAAQAVGAFVQRRGFAGFAALHHLLDGDPAALAIDSRSSAYGRPLEAARLLRLFEETAPRPESLDAAPSGEAPAARRLREGVALLREVEEAYRDLREDPFLAPSGTPTRGNGGQVFASSQDEAEEPLAETRDELDAWLGRFAERTSPEDQRAAAFALSLRELEDAARNITRVVAQGPRDPTRRDALLELVDIVSREIARRTPSVAERLEMEGLGWGEHRLFRP